MKSKKLNLFLGIVVTLCALVAIFGLFGEAFGREIGNLKKLIQDGRCQVIYIINSLGQEEADIEYINAKEFFLS